MKKIIAIFLLTISLTACGDGKRYSIEAGTIEYELTGDWQGTQTIHFDDWGTLQADYIEATIEILGTQEIINEKHILKDGMVYNLNLNDNTGIKIQGSGEASEIMSEKLIEDFGGTKVGTEEIAGKTCDIWEIPNIYTTTCLWKSISLRTTAEVAGVSMEAKAISVDENPPSADEFEIPENIKITDAQSAEE
jgi:hypothetical protein